jgi:dynein heavy chain
MAGEMKERHKWMAANVAAAFDMIDQTHVVEQHLSDYNNFKRINDFLEGRNKHRHLSIYYQKNDVLNQAGELVDAKEPNKFIITTGDHEEMRIKNHAVYFLRTVEEQRAVKMDNACDHELLFGEISAQPLESLSTGMNAVFFPMIQEAKCVQREGKSITELIDEEQYTEFCTGFEKFSCDISEGIRALTDCVDLPGFSGNGEDWQSLNLKDIATNPDMVSECERLLGQWCDLIEEYLKKPLEGKHETKDPGPRTELEFWRDRLQIITSILEQLKAKERSIVTKVLTEFTHQAPDVAQPKSKNSAFTILRKWKEHIEIALTESLNEAKDNVKYLTTLEKFIEPLYFATPQVVMDSLPALMNAVKMIYTIARYYNTSGRMTQLFAKITNEMITNCKRCVMGGVEQMDDIWETDPPTLIRNLESCIKLNDAYQKQYQETKETLLSLPKGKQFDFPETLIFGRFDLFCRRVLKLIDMFQTIHQFKTLSQHRFDGMEPLVSNFLQILEKFRNKGFDLLDFNENKFDRYYVYFNQLITEIEVNLRQFIHASFESIKSIEKSLVLLKKFQGILKRENLRADLESKFAVIFHNYGLELTQVQDQYEKFKATPPLVRNLPPVAGHITWSRHLYKRIEGPMRKFQCNPSVLAGKDSKKLIRMYNKMAKTLIEFETLWHQAWVNSVEAAKSGLTATLIIKHPEDGMKFHVNFDWEILQLIRETKCIDRMGGVEIPEAAKMVLLQEQKFKTYHSELTFLLKEYRRVVQTIKPIAVNLLKPHIENLEYKMRPGMVTLTWTSMNIEGYIQSVWQELDKLEQMVLTVNDYMENRIDANLKVVQNISLVNLPEEQELVPLEEFVEMQERHVRATTDFLVAKSTEIESAVNDMLGMIVSFELDPHVHAINENEIVKVKAHYNWSMYQALLAATKRSLHIMKMRIAARPNEAGEMPPGFFEVNLQLDGLAVCLSPSITEIQTAINNGAVAVLKCSKMIESWDTVTIPKNVQLILNPNLPPVQGTGAQGTFYDRIAQDREILKVVLLLTGSVQSARSQCDEYLAAFETHAWLWDGDPSKAYKEYKDSHFPDSIDEKNKKTKPGLWEGDAMQHLDTFALKLKEFSETEKILDKMEKSKQISALSLQTEELAKSLKGYAKSWKESFASELHVEASKKLDVVGETIKSTSKNLQRSVNPDDMDALGEVMQTLGEVREKQMEIEADLVPLDRMYKILQEYLPDSLEDEEKNAWCSMQSNWKALLKDSEARQEEFAVNQVAYKKNLIKKSAEFKKDVIDFRSTFNRSGPLQADCPPKDAVERLKHSKEQYDIRARKQAIYLIGEDLFGLPHQQYPMLDKTKKELDHCTLLYDLYTDVLNTIASWKDMLWTDVPENLKTMEDTVASYKGRCTKLPKDLKKWTAFEDLNTEITNFETILPIFSELGKPTIMPRHWQEVMEKSGKELAFDSESFKLQSLIDANLQEFADDILDICDGADKQAKVEEKLGDLTEQWKNMTLEFGEFKDRTYFCVLQGGKVNETQEALEESLMLLNTMNAQRQSAPFKEDVQGMLTTLSSCADTIERWFKVQQMWQSLESVFMAGDIKTAMPMEAKKFAAIDKEWVKVMAKSAETKFTVPCCQNHMLINLLPNLMAGLEQCQRSLEFYLEGKRNKFPRFYFTSDPVLLKILSQGSDPESIQEDFEKLFDALTEVKFAKAEPGKPRKITQIKGVAGDGFESVELSQVVLAHGNIEDWLLKLEEEMQRSIRRECRSAAIECPQLCAPAGGVSMVDFGNKTIAQVSLLGIQLAWTSDFQEALTRMKIDKQIMSQTHKKFVGMLTDLVDICLGTLPSKMIRTKYETLVTIHVHQKDVFQEVWQKQKQGKVKDDQDFEWLKQTRMYWKTEIDHAEIAIADVSFIYSYEYLGCKERLVITALTDRCYVTQSQALGMFFGGAPAGPAGTGKTETTKDMGRTLGVFVVVTNCSDQHRFKDMAKIFKGLCMSGLWGCFDEFNRIELEVLSVVAMQVETINAAKKQNVKTFMFPGEPLPIKLVPAVGYFITMNPGYAGRQALPENLKVLFRGVTMMMPNRETIMKVKLASVGYSTQNMDSLGKKFCILYALCEQQLSKQRHYDFGLRNILSVLRTSGGVKRAEPTENEEMLFYRCVRDMNLSKLVSDDTPLFLALLRDIYPKTAMGKLENVVYENIEEGSRKIVARSKLIQWDSWFLKVIQLYETSRVRHGFMLVGPTLCGKTEIEDTLTVCLSEGTAKVPGVKHKIFRMNPKAITDSQMYGIKDPISEEWTHGVFASIWKNCNNRGNKWTSWIMCDGPVDAIWIENLNTVLDDNKILTLANNDRIPMTDNCKIVFEVQDLRNASPATVSRAGIIFVSDSDLGWLPLVKTWLMRRVDIAAVRQAEADILQPYFEKWLNRPGLKKMEMTENKNFDFFDWNARTIRRVMPVNDSIIITNVLNLLSAMILPLIADNNAILGEGAYRRLLCWSIMWGFGGLLEPDERKRCWEKFIEVLETNKATDAIPPCKEGETIFEYAPNPADKDRSWKLWQPDEWKPPKKLGSFSSLLIGTMDSVRAEFLMGTIAQMQIQRTPTCFKSSLMVGAPGTAKTSTALMYMAHFSPDKMLSKNVNFSSATTPLGFQMNIEGEVERKTGKTFCPPGNKNMTVFIDDASMPLVNKWGDQVTNELTRQMIEQQGFYFLDKDKRGDFKSVLNLSYIGAMGHPGGGKNDLPNRVKSKFFCFNMVLPSTVSVENIYGSIMKAQFTPKTAKQPIIELSQKLCAATIDVWDRVKGKLLPTPSRFHYLFNMRELSRVFQGIMSCPTEVLTKQETMIGLWKHECQRVFSDKLSRQIDKDVVDKALADFLLDHFGEELAEVNKDITWFCDFQRDMVFDPETDEPLGAPKIYEPIQGWDFITRKTYEFLDQYNEKNTKKMNLVLFDDAMTHLMKVNRTLQQKRGSMMLVGVGGSGKQSLSRLAAFVSDHRCFQITITKTYNDNAFFENVKDLCVSAGQKGTKVTFLFTDAEVKKEDFLEYINSLLATGEIVGLLAKDEKETMCGEVRNDFVKECPGVEENPLNMYNYLMGRLRDNLHLALCFSPVNAKFAIRAQKFPAVFSVSINWFLPWPEEALVAVSTKFLGSSDGDANWKIDASAEDKARLFRMMGNMQAIVGQNTGAYYQRMRKHVYVTPKSYLCLIDFYKELYAVKYKEIEVQEQSVNTGIEKLEDAQKDVDDMKQKLKEASEVLEVEMKKTNKLLAEVTQAKVEADKKKEVVDKDASECRATADAINKEKAEAQVELDKAMPMQEAAIAACDSIKKSDIVDLKANSKPADITKYVFDGLMLLQSKPVKPNASAQVSKISGQEQTWLADSFADFSRKDLMDISFQSNLMKFAKKEKDTLNDEICELVEPYLRFNEDPAKHWGPWTHKVLDPELAKSASGAGRGLCLFVDAMVGYFGASKIVKPKMEALEIAEGKLKSAMSMLDTKMKELKKVMDEVAELDRQLDEANAKTNALLSKKASMEAKKQKAEDLLGGLSSEYTRWKNDSRAFAQRRKKLVGDIAVVSAFVSYVGPFNTEFRNSLLHEFVDSAHHLKVPAHEKVVPEGFLVDATAIGEWALQGLPSDDLSVQNAIMVTRASRFPLMVDPQGQANRWIKVKEKELVDVNPSMTVTTLTNKNLKEQINFTMADGLCLIIENVENEVDPMLDPVMEKQKYQKGKKFFINVSDEQMEFSEKFKLYMTSRLPNPHFSPELSAKCTVIDFTVTLVGLEQQLLGRLIGMEQKILEETLAQLQEECTSNTRALKVLDENLLNLLTTIEGNLLDNEEIVGVLQNTKAMSEEVGKKLKEADERSVEINAKREQYRSVATRGSIMYFNMVDMTLVMNPITMQPSGWMYNCSLLQFLEQFDISVKCSTKGGVTAKRVEIIIEYLTYQVYRYMNRGLFERDKMMFKLLVTLKINVIGGKLTAGDVSCFLKAGSALDSKAEKANPFKWLQESYWLNLLSLSRQPFGPDGSLFYREIVEFIQRNEANWKKWYEEEAPESAAIPDYEERLNMERHLGPFLKLVLVRSMRFDRTGVGCDIYIKSMLDDRFVAPITDFISDIFDESANNKPILYLLTAGSDPTLMIDELAKKKKKTTEKVSMGEGQETVARKRNMEAFITGGWVILQNSHLGIGYMNELEEVLTKSSEIDPDFRLWITCEITERFPIGLLQLAIKVTLEPPAGLKAGLDRTYSTTVSQDMLEKIDDSKWRNLIYSQSFLHSIVQERRKFGAIGWCVPYEYNTSDIDACLLFLEKHVATSLMLNIPISWVTVQYMVSEVQYGGRITDDLDRELFNTYTKKWMSEDVFKPTFAFNNYASDYNYKIPEGIEIAQYKEAIATIPMVDSPNIFGLHLNADLMFRQKDNAEMISTIVETQPKDTGGGSGKSVDEIVKELCEDLGQKMPPDFIEEVFRATIDSSSKLRPANPDVGKGLNAPLNIFLFQELQRLQIIIKIVRTNLKSISMAIDGTVVMTQELLSDLNSIFDTRVPTCWYLDASGAEIAWLMPNIGGWFTGLLDRATMLTMWLDNGRQVMKTYWITGFTNAQGFLTGMRQEVTRQHQKKEAGKEAWALDDVVSHTEIRDYDAERCREVPEEGQHVHGLFMEGGRWIKAEGGCLDESEPKKLFCPMPVIRFTAVHFKELKGLAYYGPYGAYDAAVYKYPKRNDRYLIVRILMKTELHPFHWKLRGVCLVAQTD